MIRYRSKVWVACLPLLAACNGTEEREPISASSMALTATQNVETALRGAHAAGSFIAESATLAKMLSTGNQSCDSSAVCAADGTCTTPAPNCTDAVTVDDLADAREDANEAIDKLVKQLKEEIFTADNLESEDGHTAIYRLKPEYLCKNSVSDSPSVPGGTGSSDPGAGAGSSSGTGTQNDAAPTAELDAECVKHANELQPRLRLTSPSDGNVDVGILLTAERRNPATLELRTDGVGLQIDLGELKATLDAAHQDTGELASMSGKFQFELKKNAELDYSFRFNVLSTLNVNTVDDLMQQIALSLAGNKPSFELRFDGNARQITGTYHFGAFGLKAPLNALYHSDPEPTQAPAPGEPAPEPTPAKTYTGLIDLLVAGFDGSVTFDGNRDKFTLRALGLGDKSSTLKHDGNLVAQLDVNANAGRHFDLSVERNDQDQATLTISPSLDASLMLKLATLRSQIEDIPAIYDNELLRIFFDGQNPSVRTEKNQIRVLSGTLNITSQAVPAANISVAPNMCLVENDTDPDTGSGTATDAPPAHEVLSNLKSGACQ